MKDHMLSDLATCENLADEAFLAEHDIYIRKVAQREVPARLFTGDVLGLEIDDFAQNIRIKLWESRQKRSILNPPAYIRMIAQRQAIDMVRLHKPVLPLSTEESGEPALEDLLVAQGEGLQDPATELEREEVDTAFLLKLIRAILALPSRQKQAVLYALEQYQDDISLLLNALKARGLRFETGNQPEQEREIHLLKASLAVARKKLQWLRECRM